MPPTAFCEKCNLPFPSFDAFHEHKIKSKDHITCNICSQDFSTPGAAKLHHDQLHAHEQNLKCPGCSKKFIRLGGLIAHIELTECNAIAKQTFDTAVKEKIQSDKNYQAAPSFQDCSGGSGYEHGRKTFNQPSPPGIAVEALYAVEHVQPCPAVYEEDNLISFDESSAILNSGWGPSYTAPTLVFNKNDFPPLGLDAIPFVKRKESVQSIAQSPLTAPLNLAERVATMAIADPSSNPFDPDTPGFDIKVYWIGFIAKYKCPYRGCNKSVEKPGAFLQHLKSPAHRNEKLQCNRCLRYYATATALTQHSESQGVRCKIRDSDKYAGVVDVITGGTATAAGRHIDDTVKYALQESMDPTSGATAIINANRQQAKALAQAREDYWKTRTPKW